MNDFGIRFVQFTNLNPVFKGAAVTVVGLVALLFALWMNKRWQEPMKGGLLVFTSLSVFIILFGLFILVFRPAWWNLPY